MGLIEHSIQEALTNEPTYPTHIIAEEMNPVVVKQLEQDASEYDCFLFFLSENIQTERVITQLDHITRLRIIIPIYGNMTIETKRWMRLHESLRGRDVYFLTASTRHYQQVQRLVLQPAVFRIPYPVAPEFFEPISTSTQGRVKLVYAGRITPQKNVLPLMEAFLRACELNPRLELHIAGTFHHIGYHLHGHDIDAEKFEGRFYELLSQTAGRIFYHQQLDQAALRSLYDESDYFITLSTHHDEDFGMSLAQAIARGLRGIASDWGGHADFARMADVALIPVSINDLNIPIVSMKKLILHLVGLEEKVSDDVKRYQQSAALRNYQQSSYRKNFYKLLDMPAARYRGQTDVFKEYARLSEDHNVFNPAIDHLIGGTSLYKKIYSCYLADELLEEIMFPIDSK